MAGNRRSYSAVGKVVCGTYRLSALQNECEKKLKESWLQMPFAF